MKAFEMIIKDGCDAFLCVRPSKDEESLRQQFGGNGEFVRVRDVTQEFDIDLFHVESALKRSGDFNKSQIELIIALLQYNYENTF